MNIITNIHDVNVLSANFISELITHELGQVKNTNANITETSEQLSDHDDSNQALANYLLVCSCSPPTKTAILEAV